MVIERVFLLISRTIILSMSNSCVLVPEIMSSPVHISAKILKVWDNRRSESGILNKYFALVAYFFLPLYCFLDTDIGCYVSLVTS